MLESSPNSHESHPTSGYHSSSASTSSKAPDSSSQSGAGLNKPAPDSSSSSSPACSCGVPVRKEDAVPTESDETLLSIYTNQLFPQFPFVIIPAGTAPKQMQVTRPLLMKAVRMIASVRHLRSMRGQSHAVIQHISHAMFTTSERSLDLLQGILVILGYYHYFCMTHAHFNNLIHLALSLIGDMDLSTCPVSRERSQLPLVRPGEPRARTNEERRILAGVWYMSSNAALVINQLGPVRYTKYLDQVLKELEDAAECETDQLAVQLVRIQHLTDKICQFHGGEQLVDEVQGIPKASAAAYLEEFQMQLDKLRNAPTSNLKSDYLLSCHYNSAYLRLFEPHMPVSQSFDSLSLSGLSISDAFVRFTAALKTWFDDWLTLPVCLYFYMPQPISVQLVHATMMLTRWAKIAGPGALKLASAGTTSTSWKEVAIPAFSGVGACPDLSVPRPPASEASVPTASAQTLTTLRVQVLAEPGLYVDVFGILDAMAVRFEAAKKEMAIAQGREWENDTWDLAAKQIKIKKSKIEKWCQIVETAAGEVRTRLADAANVIDEGSGETMNMSDERSIAGLEWLVSDDDQEGMRWESDLFDGIMRDIDLGDTLDIYGGWDTDSLNNVGLMSGTGTEGCQGVSK